MGINFEDALKAEGITGGLANLARQVYAQESGSGRNTKTTNQGATGHMQIIPRTFASVADKGWDINNPEHNMRAGIRYLGKLFNQSGGDPALAAVGYYGGPGAMSKAKKGIAVRDTKNPTAPNTLEYAQQVLARNVWGSEARPRNPAVAPRNVLPEPSRELSRDTPMIMAEAPKPVAYDPRQLESNDLVYQARNNNPSPFMDMRYDAPYVPPAESKLDRPLVMGMPQPNFQAFSRWVGRA